MPSRSPLPRVCVALGLPDADKLLEHARREIGSGESFLEFRLDYLRDPADGIPVITRVMNDQPEAVILATCRLAVNHGHFDGTVDEQVRILLSASRAGARAVDLEIESAEVAKAALNELRSEALFIVSYHNFESTPALAPVLRRMSRLKADIWKIVTTARKPSDILRVLECGKGHGKSKMILLAMGETGLPSRVLAPAFGSLYTYAAPIGTEGTAPGQIAARQLRNQYRIEKLSRSAKIYGVIACPVRHSMSPAIHNRALQARRIDAVYLPFLVEPANLRDFMQTGEKMPVSGFSVTIPHKEKIIRYLDHVDPLARRIGAVNTVWRKAGRWRGTNTDVPGVIEPLSRRMKIARSSVLVVGSGGAARGAAFALGDAGAKVAITGRTPDKLARLAKLTGAEVIPVDKVSQRRFDALVHATPLGMYPKTQDCFFCDTIPAGVVFDMVYNPLDTVLIQHARQQGLEVIRGLEMFVEQAAHQFELWTGEEAPRKLMESAVIEALG